MKGRINNLQDEKNGMKLEIQIEEKEDKGGQDNKEEDNELFIKQR